MMGEWMLRLAACFLGGSAMANDPVDDILKRFDGLAPTERDRLILQLERRQARSNGEDSGRTLLDTFADHDMIGSITDAPEDWSTNPKYMEGFGKDAE